MNAMVPDDPTAADKAAFDAATRSGNQTAARVKDAMFGLLYLLSPLRVLFPAFSWRRTTYVFGYDDVRNVLSDADVFATPFRTKMASLDRSHAVSLLGFEGKNISAGQRDARDAEYQRNLCQIMRSLPLEDLPRLARETAEQAERIVRDADELDVVDGLLTPIVLDFAQEYFGFKFSHPRQFHRWTMAISNYTFSCGKPPRSLRSAAEAAGRLIDRELDDAIASARVVRDQTKVLGRLASMVSPDGARALTNDQIRATVAGLLSGMLPNVPIAGFNVLQVLLHRPRAMALAQKAARANEDEQLQRCIMEALRFRPIDPGRQRVCVAADRSAIGPSPWLRRPIPVGRRVYAATLPAMFDGRRVRKPFRFDPSRPLSDNLALGAGKHWCVGAPLAMCLLTQMLKPLLRRTGIWRKAGAPAPTYFLGFFPESLTLQLDERAK